MIFHQQLRVPGPTPLPERVVRAMSRPMIDHRGPEFAQLMAELTDGVKRVFRTENDVLMLTCSGTGGLESAVVNLISPGDEVVVGTIGAFGDRFHELATAYGANVVRLEAEWGQAIDPEDLREVLANHPEAGVVFLTHNETSTGVTNDIESLARVAKQAGRLVVVDGVSSVSAIPVETYAWGLDVVISGSQKGWMAPPGLAFLTVNQAAWGHYESARAPRFYLDWKQAQKFATKGQTPFTPALSVMYGVVEGLRMIFEEGLEEVYARHRRIADATAAGLEAAGFTPFAAPGHRSATVTSVLPPAELDVSAFRKLLRERYGVVVAGGQGKMTGKLVRVGHLGAVVEGDVVQVLWAIEQVLEQLDIAPADGRALEAAGRVLAREASHAH